MCQSGLGRPGWVNWRWQLGAVGHLLKSTVKLGIVLKQHDHFDDGEFVFFGGGAKPTDRHLASIIHCIDDEIVAWLARRERRKGSRANPDNRQGHREADAYRTANHHHKI